GGLAILVFVIVMILVYIMFDFFYLFPINLLKVIANKIPAITAPKA
ncbi:unnamed protein product, partial [marine sediment metagenome]